MKKTRILLNFAVIAMLILVLISIINDAKTPFIKSKKIKIVTTLFPLYDFAKNIGQDKVEVMLLLPPGAQAHSFEPKPSDIARINQADIFIYTGRFMEPWVEGIIKGISNKNLTIIDSSIGIKMIPAVFHDLDEPVGSLDPHIWLDFDNDKVITNNIVQALAKKDRVNADNYLKNADIYHKNLSLLDEQYKKTLSNCNKREIIYGGHYTFGYLAKRYNLKYLAAQGISPDAEPTAQDLISLVQQIKKDNIKYIFYEEIDSSKIAETLSNETQTKILPLNTAHNISKNDFERQTSFLSIMKQNLENLKIGLECSE
jgi:zinc transport system substrate-binding protein